MRCSSFVLGSDYRGNRIDPVPSYPIFFLNVAVTDACVQKIKAKRPAYGINYALISKRK